MQTNTPNYKEDIEISLIRVANILAEMAEREEQELGLDLEDDQYEQLSFPEEILECHNQ